MIIARFAELCADFPLFCVDVAQDGYTVQVAAALVVGALWLALFRSRALHLQSLPHSDWLISSAGQKGK